MGDRGISRFSRPEVPYMPWFCDHAGSPDDSRKRRQRCCLPPFVERGHPESRISWLDSPACTCPYQRFATPLRVVDAWLGVVVGRWPFDVELFHLLLRTGLSRRFHKPPLLGSVSRLRPYLPVHAGSLHPNSGQ